MKPFDLKEALAGKPCVSKNGYIIHIFKDVREFGVDDDAPLVGIIMFNKSNYLLTRWSEDGNNLSFYDYQIAGMWEEPKLTSEQVLEKAYSENLIVCWENNDGELFEGVPVAKTKDGRYLFKDCCDFFLIDNEGGVWIKDGAQTTKSNTITVTLPKPFKPKQGDPFYYLTKIEGDFIRVKYAPSFRSDNPFDTGNSSRGNCFRTKEDAQAWLDAMKNALDD